jgi:hypothetical protein
LNGEWCAWVIQPVRAAGSRYGNVLSANDWCLPPEAIQQAIPSLGKMVWAQLTGECNQEFGILKLRVQHREYTARGFRYSDVHCRAALNSYLNAGVSLVLRDKGKPNRVARIDDRSIGAHRDRDIWAIDAT